MGVEAGLIRLEWIAQEREQQARRLFRRYQDKSKLSLTDCTSFVVMQELVIELAFTGDEHFERTDPKNFPFKCLVQERKGKYLVQIHLVQ